MTSIPRTHEEWEHCITVKCELALTADFISSPIEALRDARDYHTQKVIKIWGHEPACASEIVKQ